MEHVATNQTLITTRLTMKLFFRQRYCNRLLYYQADEAGIMEVLEE
jgi:hypothetical protein